MGFEGFADNQNKERREKSERERKEEISQCISFEKTKEKAMADREKRRQLQLLKSGVERGIIRPDAARESLEGMNKDLEIQNILSTIESVENIPHIDHLLVPALRITRQEYLQATTSPDSLLRAQKKVDSALQYLIKSRNDQSILQRLEKVFGTHISVKKNLSLTQSHQTQIRSGLTNVSKK